MSKRKYKRGKRILSVDDFEKSENRWFVVRYGGIEKTTHRGWIESWQYHMLKNVINAGRLYEAEMRGEKDE